MRLGLTAFIRTLDRAYPRWAVAMFAGAHIAGNALQWTDFPMQQTLAEWQQEFSTWQQVVQRYL